MRNFKKAYRVNIINYYRARRLEYAKRALRGGSLTVGALAEQLNFTDIYSFSRFFKMQTGMSPSEYREKKGGAESL
jgi:AraC-like DNA-binding protein